MSKFKLTQTATEVQDILNNSLQKPTGLTKTKLVGVGVNGQENIEIGDNLTLANGKLAAMGSLPSTITFDAEGNRTVGKNLGVDGKLKLKSLVSASNPDGDITKELGGGGGGGGAITQHKVLFQNSSGIECLFFFFALSTTAPYRDQLVYEMSMDNVNNWFLHGKERDFLATGYLRDDDDKIKPIVYVHMAPTKTSTYIYYLDTTSFIQKHILLPNGQFQVGESIAITTSN